MNELRVDPESLRGGADGLDTMVDQLGDALEQFESQIQAMGQVWGGDDLGSIIGMLYQGIHDLALQCFESNGEVIGQFADGLHLMADSFDGIEGDIEGGFRDLRSSLGG